MTLRLAMPRLAAIGVLAALGCHCAGSSHPQPTERGPAMSAASPLGPAPSFEPLSIDVAAGEPLDEAFARIRAAYAAAGIETFDPRLAYATSPAHELAWYFTLNDAHDSFRRTHHIFFVVTESWDDRHTRAFLLSYLVMPGVPQSEVGRLWFHFYSAEPPPFAVRYLFSNTVQGAVEAALLTELGARSWGPSDIPSIAQRAREIFDRFGIETPPADLDACPAELDALYSSLPRPPEGERGGPFGSGFTPEGTLAAVGVLVGESIRRQAADVVSWEADDHSIYPRLRVDGPRPGILRPIPMIIELYLAGADVLPSDYCNRMLHNVIGD